LVVTATVRRRKTLVEVKKLGLLTEQRDLYSPIPLGHGDGFREGAARRGGAEHETCSPETAARSPPATLDNTAAKLPASATGALADALAFPLALESPLPSARIGAPLDTTAPPGSTRTLSDTYMPCDSTAHPPSSSAVEPVPCEAWHGRAARVPLPHLDASPRSKLEPSAELAAAAAAAAVAAAAMAAAAMAAAAMAAASARLAVRLVRY
jgi:hypothetical protein